MRLVVVLTPAISRDVPGMPSPARRGRSRGHHRHLPPDVAEHVEPALLETVMPKATDTPHASDLARRLRLPERSHEMRKARETGVPIVPWAGPGTLDIVLRDLGRRSRAAWVVSR